ncbi:MAG TPA: Rieske (2Fe-2S) protein, partial [Phycisphaerales bacterium]|nr:Rieske (2Fe-2S) protein [Phycisphaerales bacterium]
FETSRAGKSPIFTTQSTCSTIQYFRLSKASLPWSAEPASCSDCSSGFSLDVAETRNLTEKSLPWRVSNNLVAASSDIAEGQIRPASLGSREIVLFRTKGRIHALDPHCSHMGAKLCQGKIDGEHLVCPLHGWRYSGNGEVAGGMGRIRSWPVQETLGGILVFNGPKPLYAPPAHQPEFRWGGAASTLIDAPWFALTANAFDTHHYEAVHRLILPPGDFPNTGRTFL